MFKIFVNAWRVQDVRKKLLFIFLLLLIYRLGSSIPLPGIDLEMLYMVRHGGLWDAPTTIFNMIMGGGLGSLFAMGIAPYITASIIMQLLTYAIPKLSEMQKEGEDGRKKIGQITRYMSVGLAALQSAAMVFSWTRLPLADGFSANLFRPEHQNFFVYMLATVAMITGTIFIMWLAEILTEKGIGNGASFLIFANILAALPNGAMNLWMLASGGEGIRGPVLAVLLLAVFALVIAFVVWVHEGERRIPVQYSRKAASGRAAYGNNTSYFPLKVNIAGVMSIIFAISLLHFPMQIQQFFPNAQGWGTVVRFLAIEHWVGATLYVVLIFVFTHFYTSFAVNPQEIAENLKKNGGFIPGIRPGTPTKEYFQTTVTRLSWIGAVFYSLIALMPVLIGRFIPEFPVGFGGTTLLIVTGVALEFIKQLESQLLMRHYKGFLSE